MMKVAALYDIHGNLPALEAVMQEIRQLGVELIVLGGDVMPGPMPRETLDYLLNLEIPTRFIMGNGDDAVLAELTGKTSDKVPERVRSLVQWTARQLEAEHQQAIAGWPLTVQITVESFGDVLFCHATPRNNTEIFTRLTAKEKLLPVFEGVNASLVVCGHTHMQFERSIGGLQVVNAGSVGMPYGKSEANWLLLGEELEFRKTSYDLIKAAELIRMTSYPMAEDFADNNLLKVPSEEEALDVLSKSELV
jgi:putative phosphoesterase